MKPNHKINLLIAIAALGYFVDIYDLILFNVVKKESLLSLGFTDAKELQNLGIRLFNWQMGGMLIGGLLWGILGDKKGRVQVLFGSILMYSVANIANAFVTDITTYAAIRFIAGIGLAGELGAGITLVSEVMHKSKRGIGTMIIVSFGALGAVLAAFVGSEGKFIAAWFQNVSGIALLNWQVAYIIGGILGLMLLIVRMGALESDMFKNLDKGKSNRGDFLQLLKLPHLRSKYIRCILIGLPIWYVVGILVALSEPISRTLGVNGVVITGSAVMFSYIGLSVGDVLSGILSQWMKSRKKVVIIYLIGCVAVSLAYFFTTAGKSVEYFYFLCFLLGTATGFWALFVTIAAEQFGTNIRSTVATTSPNFVRGAVIPITESFRLLDTHFGATTSGLIVGTICIGLSFWAVNSIEESFSKDLDYLETM
jgi:MFS family permease